MKFGRTLQELALEIQRQDRAKKDYLVSTEAMHMADSGNAFDVDSLSAAFGVNDIAHTQIGQYLEIPARYYDRMRTESPALLAQNVNHWLGTREPERRMLRTLDGNLRAFLSDRYRRIDNVQIVQTTLPIIGHMDGAKVESCEITETKMYIKVVNPRLQEEVRVGDVVQSGIIISNSEVGRGSVNVSPLIYRLACSNGMIAQDSQVRKYHIGRANDMDYDMSIYRDETLEADDHAFLLKVRDAVNAAFDHAMFARLVQQMRDATEARIEPIAVPKVVELTSKQFGITSWENGGVLGHLIDGGDLTLYGVANAVTRYAQDIDSYDRSTELEATGYRILSMPASQWRSIASEARKDSI